MATKPGKVDEKYFGHPLSNSQDPDEPNDPVQRKKGLGDSHMQGRGSQGGGSKPTPQTQHMHRGSGKPPKHKKK